MTHSLPTVAKPPAPDEVSSGLAYQQGLELSKLLALFGYFLKHTPEGKKVRRELEADWQKTVQELRQRGKIRGAEWSCSQWLKKLRQELVSKSSNGNRPRTWQTSARDKNLRSKAGLKFKGIK
jgi:hypothetical protein